MRRFLSLLAAVAVIGVTIGWWLTAPERVDPAQFNAIEGVAENGKLVFAAAGCASCHAAPKAEGEDRLILAGGKAFASPFGTFYAPNISFGPDSKGISEWSVVNLADALVHGTSPGGKHYFPALPYTSYSKMTSQDVADLYAYMRTLPASSAENLPHDVGFPFNIRRSLGGWKLLFYSDDWVMPAETAEIERGRYLVEALGHCAECHTPRNILGGLQKSKWLQGAPDPSGQGNIPPITPDKLGWNKADIAAYLSSGFTPEFDSAGGEMAEVVQNMAELPESDLLAIAAYLLALPESGD